MRTCFLLIFFLSLASCRDECLYDECEAYLGEAELVFQAGTVYTPGQTLRGLFQPTVLSTTSGSLVVFAQGRINSSEDDEDKVLIFSRSEDRGQTWSRTEFLTLPASFWGASAFLSKDEATGKEKLNALLTYSKPKLFELYSDEELLEHFNINVDNYDDDDASILYHLTSLDDGLSWHGQPASQTFLNSTNASGKYIAFFSCVGQSNRITNGPFAGRIIIGGPVSYADIAIVDPFDIYAYQNGSSSMIYSDDEGLSWQIGGITEEGGNEASVAAIEGGETIMMIRRRNGDYPSTKRIVNYSADQGRTWTANAAIEDLPSPKCLGILYDDGERLLYSSPKHDSRTQGWIGYSHDEGSTWDGRVVEPGLFSYSDITRIKGTESYIVAYSLLHHGELGLAIRIFNESWLLN